VEVILANANHQPLDHGEVSFTVPPAERGSAGEHGRPR
jgi:hypothetical protein